MHILISEFIRKLHGVNILMKTSEIKTTQGKMYICTLYFLYICIHAVHSFFIIGSYRKKKKNLDPLFDNRSKRTKKT